MLHPEKLATPEVAFSGFVVQVSVPPPGLVPITSVMVALLPVPVVTVLLNWSSTVTTGCADHVVPPVPPPGCVVNTTLFAAALFTVKLLLVVELSEPSVAVSVNEPVLVGTRFEKVATPFDAATEAVPVRTPPLLIAIATVEVSPVTVLPLASCTSTVTAGLIALPAAVAEGC